MNKEDVQSLIDKAIRAHELRVAFWSGLLGAALVFCAWPAIWLFASVGSPAIR